MCYVSYSDSAAIPPSLPPSEGSLHYRLLLDPDCVSVDNLTMECVVVIVFLDAVMSSRESV